MNCVLHRELQKDYQRALKSCGGHEDSSRERFGGWLEPVAYCFPGSPAVG